MGSQDNPKATCYDRVAGWLMDSANPSIRYLTARILMARPETDEEVKGCREGQNNYYQDGYCFFQVPPVRRCTSPTLVDRFDFMDSITAQVISTSRFPSCPSG